MRYAVTFLMLASLLGGCSSASTYRMPGVDWSQYKRLYVELNLADDHGLHEIIASELRAVGHEVSTGHLTMMPRDIDAIVTYRDRWTWDFKTYLIDIEIKIREARSQKILATGRYYRPGITDKPAVAMVREVIQSIYRPGKPAKG